MEKGQQSEHELRLRAIRAAQGKAPFDLLIANGTLVDVATSELREADVGIVGNLIASVHPRGARRDAAEQLDASGCFVAPGFIDAHVHFESSHMTPANYASLVVPQGTTTIFYDPHELANALGLAGVRWAIEASRGLPLRYIAAAPSCVPSAPGLETSGAEFGGDEMREMLSWPEVAGVAEMMDMNGVLGESRRAIEILTAGRESGKLIEGHARGLTGDRLQAYAAAGVSSDHEIMSAEDGIEKLRAGLFVELRGSHDYVLPPFVEALKRLPQIPATLAICTDDVPPDQLVERGGMCDVLRRLIRYGLDPVQAIRCATMNAATRLWRGDLGLVAAGRVADIAVLGDLREVTAKSVVVGGCIVARDGRMLAPPTPANAPALPQGKLPLGPYSDDDFRVPVLGTRSGRARIRAIKGARFTSLSEVEVDVANGFAVVPPGFSVILVQHRHGRHNAGPQRTLLEDWGELRGAVATTYSHDSHNLVVLGRDPRDMRVAAEALMACGGGMAVVKEGKIIAKVDLPLAGMLSDAPPAELARAFAMVRDAAGRVIEWQPPYRVFKAIEGTALACNPGPHLTDLGIADGTSQQMVRATAADA
jgi:adenine deaminase